MDFIKYPVGVWFFFFIVISAHFKHLELHTSWLAPPTDNQTITLWWIPVRARTVAHWRRLNSRYTDIFAGVTFLMVAVGITLELTLGPRH